MKAIDTKCFILLGAVVLAGSDLWAQPIRLKRDFKNPPAKFRSVPFWHLNGMLTTLEIDRQLSDAAKAGFGGVAVLPVTAGNQHPTGLPAPGMSPPYLSEAYFDRYEDILKSAKSNGLNIILYDDVDFPSGTAGGKLKADYPDMTRKMLVKTDTMLQGPGQIDLLLPTGTLMAAVAKNDLDRHIIDLTGLAKNGRLSWALPEGRWKVMFFTCEADGSGIVDYMDPNAVRKFIGFTYEEYARRYGAYFGNTIRQTFYDDVGYVTKESGWTLKLNEKFRQKYGKDPRIYYPALWEDIGPETEAARVAFFDTRAELLAEGFPKLIADWNSLHGLLSSGHPPGNYEIQPVDMNFDIFKFYRHSHVPAMDAIFYHGHGREGFKLVSSAADAYDRPVVAAELYGAFLEDQLTVKTMYQTAMEIFARGINFLIPHGMWYDPKPQSVRIPPLISSYSEKIGPALVGYNNFVARACLLLQGGKRVADIGILYPIAALEGSYHFEAKDNPGVGKFVSAGTDYLKLSDLLTNVIHQDFTFIHPELFVNEQYHIADKQVWLTNKVNSQNYKVMILPGGKVVSYHALKKIKSFYDLGGKVIATSLLPYKSAEFGLDSGVVKLIKEIFGMDPENQSGEKITSIIMRNTNGGMSSFISKPDAKSLAGVLSEMEISPDVIFENNPSPNSGNGALSYIHKIKDKRDIYYIANSTDSPINTYVDLRGKIDPILWDPNTGENSKIKDSQFIHMKGQLYTRVKLNLPAVKSVFITSK